MSVEIKTASIEPVRPTFGSVARRFGTDKVASRYQEASFDLQATANFHYRPVWDPEREVYDARRTALRMRDWDAFKDPRQFYYATYCFQRARMQESAEKNFAFVEKNGLTAPGLLADAVLRRAHALLPLRHAEWAANQHNCFITAYCFGSSMAQGAIYDTMDRLGIAQYLSRIGLLLDGNTGTALEGAKTGWLTDPAWQGLRRITEDLLVCKDWFELFVAQNLVIDGLLHPLAFARPGNGFAEPGTATLAMLTEFIEEWFPENRKWVDACIQVAVAESADNRALVSGWARHWQARVMEALVPLAARLQGLPDDGDGLALLDSTAQAWATRVTKLGVTLA
jgi:phenol hydroxylase P1 protein